MVMHFSGPNTSLDFSSFLKSSQGSQTGDWWCHYHGAKVTNHVKISDLWNVCFALLIKIRESWKTGWMDGMMKNYEIWATWFAYSNKKNFQIKIKTGQDFGKE